MNSSTTSEDLTALFGEHGAVSSAKVITDKETGNSKCYGFVEMDNEMEGMNAINSLNECTFQGRKIVVKRARPREEYNEQRTTAYNNHRFNGYERNSYSNRSYRENHGGRDMNRRESYIDRSERRYQRMREF